MAYVVLYHTPCSENKQYVWVYTNCRIKILKTNNTSLVSRRILKPLVLASNFVYNNELFLRVFSIYD